MMTQVDVPNPLTPPAEVERQAGELAAIRRMLHASQGTFSLSIAVCNSPALRDYLIGQLRADFPAIQVISIPKGTIDVFGHVAGTAGGDPPQALFLVDLEASTPSADESQHTLRSLNASRDLWESRYRCPVVLWLPEFAATLLCEWARDLWRYRSHRFEFVSELAAAQRGVADAFVGAPSTVAGLSAEEKRFRIAELEQRIAEARERPGDEMSRYVSQWLKELALLHRILGDLGHAEALLREAMEIDERLGDVYSRAVTMGRIADVLRARGELDEALRIRREDQLPAFERLGDVYSRAVTMGKIADILRARGELDEALRIRREDELPVYERLGDRRSLLVGRTNLAIGLLQRGKAGDREEAVALLRSALDEAGNMRIPEAGVIAGILERLGEAS